MTPENAAATAREALIWMAGEPEILGAFLATGGLAPGDLRGRADDPEFLGFLLDFLLHDEATLLAFCAAPASRRPSRHGRAALPGGDTPDWT